MKDVVRGRASGVPNHRTATARPGRHAPARRYPPSDRAKNHNKLQHLCATSGDREPRHGVWNTLSPVRRFSVLSIALFAACALEGTGPEGVDDADAGRDGGAFMPGADAGPSPTDAGVMPPEEDLGLAANPTREDPTDSFEGAAGLGARARCFDETDNDGSGQVDCESTDCQTLASCCVDRADCCAPVASDALPTSLTFACTTVEECFAGSAFVSFGSPDPFVVDEALAAGGDASFDSGVLVGDPIDLASRRVALDARFDRTACADATCVASFAVGFTTQATLAESAHVDPLVAMQVSAARDGIALLAGGRVVARVDFDAGALWTLVARPDGIAELLRDGTSVASTRIASAAGARVVFYGHATNPSATADPGEPRVLLRSFGARVAACDMVRAWTDATELVVYDGALPAALEQVTDVAVAARDADRWLAFTNVADGVETLYVARDRTGLVLDRNALPEGYDAARHPTLAFDETGTLFLVAELDASLVALRHDPELDVLVVDESLALGSLPAGLTEPSLLFHREHAVLVGKRPEGLFVYLRGPQTGGLWEELRIPLDTRDARAPSLVVHHDAYFLHTTWRRGSYGGVSVAVSDELVAWRPVQDDVLTTGTLDRSGTRALDALSSGQLLELVTVADDGVRQRLASRFRAAPSGAEFTRGAP